MNNISKNINLKNFSASSSSDYIPSFQNTKFKFVTQKQGEPTYLSTIR